MSTHHDALLDSLLVSDGVGFVFAPRTGHAPVQLPESNREDAVAPAGSEVFYRSIYSAEERRVRRKISNRESARRSRIRKQRRLEELRLDVDRLQTEKRVLAGRLGAVRRSRLLLGLENERLVKESYALRRRLSEVRRVVLRRWLPMLLDGKVSEGGGYVVGNNMLLASLIA